MIRTHDNPVIVLHSESEAAGYLRAALEHPGTGVVRIEARVEGIAVKVNEGAWTHTLATGRPGMADLHHQSATWYRAELIDAGEL